MAIRQMFASMSLVIYLSDCLAVGYVPTSSVIHLVCCCLQKKVNTESLKNKTFLHCAAGML